MSAALSTCSPTRMIHLPVERRSPPFDSAALARSNGLMQGWQRVPSRGASRLNLLIFLCCGLPWIGWPGSTRAAESRPLLGPVEELKVLDDFTTNSQAAWKPTGGSNVEFKFEAGLDIPGIANSLARVELSNKDLQDRVPGHNWFTMKRSLPAGLITGDAKGIRLVMGSQPAAQWWINVALHAGNKTYAHVIQPTYPNRTLIEHVIPFEEFTAADQVLDRSQAVLVDEINLDTSVPNATLYIDRITTYRQESYTSWLAFTSSHLEHNIFQPGESVRVTLTPGGTLPAAAKAVRYEVQDFYEHVAASGKVTLDGVAALKLDLTPKTHGYYELRAYWIDETGKDLEGRSCILAEGSLPSGVATFAMMPRTMAQNIERFKALGAKAFFGLHGDFHGLADLMGLTWRFDYSLWSFLEPQKPDRSQGLAPWAAQRIKSEPPRAGYRFHILPFAGNFGAVGWAKEKANKTPPYMDWEDYLPMVRDYVEVEKHLYPHMHPRIYGVAWEVNLNMPPDNLGSPHTPADVVELHRRAREVIKAADPDSLVIGPCPSNLNPQWMDSIFAAGLLEYVDAIESHGYADGGFAPEENDYPGKLAAIRSSMRRHNHGKELPIYITEAGIRGMLGSKIVHRSQAQFLARLAIILKGEGIKVFLPFYGIDYDRDGWWGFCFNLEVDARSPWSTQRISPKPAVNALATCASVLEGAAPVRRAEGLGENVWGYLFDRQGISILAIWSPTGQRRVSLRAGDARTLEVLDIMGHSSRLTVQNGTLDLAVDGSPRYVVGLPQADVH
ncbi:MAG TPA: hypothetical protein VJA21_14270 [Verrucomicrobiae bacterium]